MSEGDKSHKAEESWGCYLEKVMPTIWALITAKQSEFWEGPKGTDSNCVP